MIISGLQTGNTRWLAAHLQNAAENECIEIVEVTGTVATDIDGALAEFDALTAGTRAREGVYAAFINPPVPLTRDQYDRAVALLEERLGLAGQPRIILFHEKAGREHCHIVWSRIDLETMKAVHLSHDRQKLRRCAQDLAAEFGTKLPPNLARDRGIARFDDPPQPTKAERAMEQRSGLSREERRAAITACYRNSDSAGSFANALEAAGYMLARGDKRAYVVVDTAGDVHSLARQIDGAKTKDVRKKLEGLTLSHLPPVDQAKAAMAQRATALQDAVRAKKRNEAAAEAAHERLTVIQRKRRLALEMLWQKMKVRQMHEWKVLLAHIDAERKRCTLRRHWLSFGLVPYLKKIAVIRQLIEYYDKHRKRTLEEQHSALMESVKRRHENEAAELRRRYEALSRLCRREDLSFLKQWGETIDAVRARLQSLIEEAAARIHRAYGGGLQAPAPGATDPARIQAQIDAHLRAAAQMLKSPAAPTQERVPPEYDGIHAPMNARADFWNAEFSTLLALQARVADAADDHARAADDDEETEGRCQGVPCAGPRQASG